MKSEQIPVKSEQLPVKSEQITEQPAVKRPPLPPKPKHEDQSSRIPSLKTATPNDDTPKSDDLTSSIIKQSRIPTARVQSSGKEEAMLTSPEKTWDVTKQSKIPSIKSPRKDDGTSSPSTESKSCIPMASPPTSARDSQSNITKQSQVPGVASEEVEDPIKQSRIPTAKSNKPEIPSKPKIPAKPSGGQSLDAIKQSRLPSAKQVEIKVLSKHSTG